MPQLVLGREDVDRPSEEIGATLGISGELAELAFRRAGRGALEHGVAVASGAVRIARAYGMPTRAVRRVRLAGLVHDIGKSDIALTILDKPGALDPSEWAVIRGHPQAAAQLLRCRGMEDIADWVLSHHERPDGRGYPHGRGAEEIPFEARILAVADTYHAMTSDLAYRPAMSAAAASDELRRVAGTQLDGAVVTAFLDSPLPQTTSHWPYR